MPSERVSTQPPGGSWEGRNPTFGESVKALFRRSFLVKIRDSGTIASEVIATVIIVILWILWNFGTQTEEAIPTPEITTFDELWGGSPSAPALVALFNKDLILGRGGHWVAAPDNQATRTMIANYYGHQKIPILDMGKNPPSPKEYVNQSEYWVYVNDKKGIQKSFDSIDAFSNGIQWLNSPDDGSNDVDWTKNMSVVLYENQNLIMFLSTNLICSAVNAFGGAGKYRSTVAAGMQAGLGSYDLSEKGFNVQPGSIFNTPEIYQQRFARPKVENEIPINTAVAFFAAIPIVIASMPDLTMILSDKDTHIMTFIFLMGASEPAYWLVSFVSTFVMCFIPYLVMDILFCTAFCLKGTDFSLLIILTILFIISYIMFQAFLSTFFTSSASGRVLTVVFLILIVFFGYLNEVYTLDAADSVKHVFSLFPIECYTLAISVMYEEVRNKRKAFTWSMIGDESYKYPIYWAFCWLIADAVIWFLLFCFFNAVLDRGFGAPPIGWDRLFKFDFKKPKDIELDDIDEGQYIMKIEGLTKQYKGKQTLAVDDVSFNVKKGEIIVMIGPNGAGKSSIINTVSGAIPATSGTIQLGTDEPSTRFTGIQKCLGIVFQDNVIINLLSIKEHLEIFGAFRGIPKDVLNDAIDFFADTLQLREMLPNRAGDLSGGQKRKLCIALALLGNPPIIIMDEPTAGVDVQARQLIWKTISGLTNSTCIITTHALEEAEAVSSRMFVVSRGKLPFIGTSSELRNEFKCGYLLKLDCKPELIPKILEETQKFVPAAKLLPDRDDTITLPVDGTIPKMLSSIDEKKKELGYEDYSFSVEQLEDVLLRILETS